MLKQVVGKKILVIDDEEYLVRLLKSRLLIHRFEVKTATGPREGLEQLEKEKPDLIVLDVLMPDMNGVEFVREIRKTYSSEQLPVIVISAQPDTKSLFNMSDISAFVDKPFQPDDFIHEVKQALHRP
jgi:DNA-binding response OmpR family regulator